jgi:glutamine synthetase
VGLINSTDELEALVQKAAGFKGEYEKASFFKDEVVVAMAKLRKHADALEEKMDRKSWPMPTYGELMFSF